MPAGRYPPALWRMAVRAGDNNGMAGIADSKPLPQLPVRASDAERDEAVAALRERFAAGALSQNTFVGRMEAALDARDRSELADLFADLPPPGLAARARMGRPGPGDSGRRRGKGRGDRVGAPGACVPATAGTDLPGRPPGAVHHRPRPGMRPGHPRHVGVPAARRPAPLPARMAAGRPRFHQRHPAQRLAGTRAGPGPARRPGQLRRGHVRPAGQRPLAPSDRLGGQLHRRRHRAAGRQGAPVAGARAAAARPSSGPRRTP